MKRALVLSGGANRGAFQVGVLKRWMTDEKKDYDIIVGNSVGAINAACLSQAPYGDPVGAIELLEELWLSEVCTENVYKRWWPFGRMHALWLKSLYDSTPLHELIHRAFNLNMSLSSGRVASVGAVCLDTGENRYVTQSEPNFEKWIIASASLPVFFSPVDIDGKLWGDGGIRHMAPIDQAITLGADEIDVIMTSDMRKISNWNSVTKRAIPDQIYRVINMMGNKGIHDDIELLRLKNDLARAAHKNYRQVKVNITYHKEDIGYNSLDFAADTIQRLIKLGHDATNVCTMTIE
jgi:NTE family protein